MKPKTLGLRPAARALGISHSNLKEAADRGRCTREADGTFDVEKVRKQLQENVDLRQCRKPRQPANLVGDQVVDEAVGQPTSPNQSKGFAEAQRQREWVRLERERMDLQIRRGELIPLREINAWVAGMIIRARDILLRIGPELRDRLAQETDPAKCGELIDAEVRQALAKLSEYHPNRPN